MSDMMRPLSFEHLMGWARQELAHDSAIFGIHTTSFWHPDDRRTITDSFGDQIANPVGPAAGPSTQLSNNILACYLSGARFMELKTVQKMDGAELMACVPKPCIEMMDEGYNCEWSTELTVQAAFDEYVRAWFACAFWGVELGIGWVGDVAFNMSVGYDLEGIKLPKIDDFIEGLKDASATPVWAECHDWLAANLDSFENFTADDLAKIPTQISNSVTLSTLHGCPAGEIESIAMHLITEKGLNTFVKCNPTMLGYDYARDALDRLGFDYIAFDDHHFTADLQFSDAVPMLHRLADAAAERGVRFGVKLTNTFPVQVKAGELPSEEMYMSGRSLLVLSMSLALKLSEAFDGALPISYSGGVDALNIESILSTGIQPVTVATSVLKPGGPERFAQMARRAAAVMTDAGAIDVAKLRSVVAAIFEDPTYHKRYREKFPSRKTGSDLPLVDCFKAPCEDGGCPIHQQIPEYLELTAAGKYDEAFKVIALDNTSPTINGVLCAQNCREHCTRLDYDTSIHIRDVKLVASDHAQDAFSAAQVAPPLVTDKKIAIIGAGPAGIGAAIFLRRNGIDVDVFEKLDGPYGIVRYIIPKFRISEEQIQRDFKLATDLGVNFHFNADPEYDVAELKKTYSHVIIATGSWGKCMSPVREGQELVIDALDFLWDYVTEGTARVGKRVAVVGAGDVAMDCVRAASRIDGVEKAFIVYRRNEPNMPATQEEVNTVRAEGLEIIELLAPQTYDGAVLHCEEMVLGDKDDSGRRSMRGTGRFVDVAADTVIGATGATINTEPYLRNGLLLDDRGRAVLDYDFRSTVENVFVIGDGRLGPKTIVQAIADAKTAARAIMRDVDVVADYDQPHPTVHENPTDIRSKRALLVLPKHGADEGSRCLACQDVCEICTEVCPNRANVSVQVGGFADPFQIVHIDGLCNECGNCATFCPHSGRPYKDKITTFWTHEDFEESTNAGFLRTDEGYLVRLPSGEVTGIVGAEDERLPRDMAAVLRALQSDYDYLLAAPAGK